MPTELETTFKDRPYAGDADLQAVCDLINAIDAHDKLDDNIDVEALRVWLSVPDIDPQRDIRLWHDGQGNLAAFAQVEVLTEAEGEPTRGRSYIRVRPDVRGTGIEDMVVSWLEDRVREVARERNQPGKLFAGSRDYDTYMRGMLEEHGFQLVRYFFRMERPLSEPIPEPQFPEGFTLTYVKNDTDLAGWVDAYNLSFIDHWGYHPTSLESCKHWRNTPEHRKEEDLIAVAPEGTVAGFCLCGIPDEENKRNNRNVGWIHVLGTKRGYRGIGLGKALLLAGLQRLKVDGAEVAQLGVDAENPTGALGLYERAGFYRTITNTYYGKDV